MSCSTKKSRDDDNIIRRFGIDPKKFYGQVYKRPLSPQLPKMIMPIHLCRRFKRLLGPSSIWKSFRKQQEALDFLATTVHCDLLPFAYESLNGNRFFLVAHPIAFWFIDEQRDISQRHTYEIIQEFKPCKLYFDLEFEREYHIERDGYKMVKEFIYLVCQVLKTKYSVKCNEKNILNLDSSSPQKFSCHLIFQNVIFCNNYHAGRFVKRLCYEIRFNRTRSDTCLLRHIDISRIDIDDFFVIDSKNNQKLFCDEGVYTKNRHFRIYKSSKTNKQVTLQLSFLNSCPIRGNDNESREEFTFLSSLVTYCNSDLPVLTYDDDFPLATECRKFSVSMKEGENSSEPLSPFREIDECVEELIYPGKIYRSSYFKDKHIIVYDIIGNRYCHNIGRQHKSNNVMYIVDLNDLMYYQKCYDPDCSGFRSKKFKLPLNSYSLQREFVPVKINIEDGNLMDELLITAAEQCEASLQTNKTNQIDFPDDQSDDYMVEVAIKCESCYNPSNN